MDVDDSAMDVDPDMVDGYMNFDWTDNKVTERPHSSHPGWTNAVSVEQLERALVLLNMHELMPFAEWNKEPSAEVAMFERTGLPWHAAVLRRARWAFVMAWQQRNQPRLQAMIRAKLNLPEGMTYMDWKRGQRGRPGIRNISDLSETPAFLDHVYEGGLYTGRQTDFLSRGNIRTEISQARYTEGILKWQKDRSGCYYPPLSDWPDQVLNPVSFRRMADALLLKNDVSLPQNPAEDRTCQDTHSSTQTQQLRERRLRPIPPALQQTVKTESIAGTLRYYFNLPSIEDAIELGFDIHQNRSVELTAYQRGVKLLCSPRTSVDSMLIWHPTGSGKTMSMISVMNNFAVDWIGQQHRHVFVIVPNKIIAQELTRNLLVDPGYLGTRLRSMDKGRAIAEGSFLTVAQVKQLNKIVTISTYRQIGGFLGYDVDGTRRRPPRSHPVLAPEDADEAFNPLDNACLIMDEVHNLLDITIKRNKSTMAAVLSLRHAIQDAQNLRAYGFTATPNPNTPMELISLLNYLRCSTTHQIKPELDASGTGISKALLETASTMISLYEARHDSKRFPRSAVEIVPVPLSRSQYDALKTWYTHFYPETDGKWQHNQLPNPFVRSKAAIGGGKNRIDAAERRRDVVGLFQPHEQDLYQPTPEQRVMTQQRDVGGGGAAPVQRRDAGLGAMGGGGGVHPVAMIGHALARRAKKKQGKKGKKKKKKKMFTSGGDGMNLGDVSDEDPFETLDDALTPDDVVHPVWGTGKVLKMWTKARQTCYTVPGSTRSLKNDPSKRQTLVQSAYELCPKIEMLVSLLAYYDAFNGDGIGRGRGEMGKHIVFANFRGPGLHAVAHFLSAMGGDFERISSLAQLSSSVQQRPDAIRFIALEAVTKETKTLLRAFNAENNRMGKQINIALLQTSLFKEGVDFKGVACAHILDPPGTYGELLQIIGRPVRLCSHARLEAEYGDRVYVHLFVYCSVIGHPQFYDGRAAMSEFPGDLVRYWQEKGVWKGAYGQPLTLNSWPLLNSSPDEMTLKHLAHTKRTMDGMLNTIRNFAADRVVAYNRRVRANENFD